LIDFDYIAESLLPSLSKIQENKTFQVGTMNYDVIIVPGCETLRSTTLDRLEAFQKTGGKIIFLGELPRFVDAVESNKAKKLAEKSTVIPFSKGKLMQELNQYRDIEIIKQDGSPSDNLFYQMRKDANNKWLFISHVYKMKNPDVAEKEKIKITIKGEWKPTIFYTMNGEIRKCDRKVIDGNTVIHHEFYPHDSLLLKLEPNNFNENEKRKDSLSILDKQIEEIKIEDPVNYSLSEPNVLLLDMAEYSFDGRGWQQVDEILRIDNKFRELLNYPLRMNKLAQPWTIKKEEPFEHVLKLKFSIESDIDLKNLCLALENVENTKIFVNKKHVEPEVVGWFVDKSIKKVKIPNLRPGTSEIILEIPFNSKTNVEWCYLLGDFGVKVSGKHKKIVEPQKALTFGNWVNQGLPFYAGNVTYHCTIECNEGNLTIEVPQFRNPLLSISVDGQEKGKIAFAPYTLELGKVNKGKHDIDITAYGNRINAFGTVHNCDDTYFWFGPDAWRTTGSRWSYEYRLKPMGILVSPKIYLKQ
jgi:hypothetical protein